MYKYVFLAFLLPAISFAKVTHSPPDYIVEIVKEKSAEYNIPFIIPLVIIQDESGYDPKARGDGGMSRGLAQIHKKWNPDVSDKEADDIEFAIEFLISNLAKGHCSWWSTYPMSTCPFGKGIKLGVAT